MNEPELRYYSMLDNLIRETDHMLNNIFCEQTSSRVYPADACKDVSTLSTREKKQAAGLIRVNHAGEVSAQALYQGQSLTARDPSLRIRLRTASIEESDHLNWCRRRLKELGEKPSILDPLWYLGSFVLGITAGIAGDRWNLGFLAETEYQVTRHLDSHIKRLPMEDVRSLAIITQMREDELGHARLAEELGAAKLPSSVRMLMKFTSKVMTTVSERL